MADQDLIAFLYARYDEETTAAKLVPRPYRLYIYPDGVMAEPEEYDASSGRPGYKTDADGNDVLPNGREGALLVYDADKALREIAAKRKIVDRFRRTVLLRSHSGGEKVANKYYSVLASSLEVLAVVYHDHPDYRSKWFED